MVVMMQVTEVDIGNIFGIAAYDAAAGAEVEVSLAGVYELPKAAGQILEGAAVWWDTSPGNVINATAAGAYPIGVAVRAAGTDQTTCHVRLSGIPVMAAST
jgi:predicted RecA/RadA family phage recombinase